MNTDKISEFKSRLEEEFEAVKQELQTVGVQNPENPSDWEAKETEMDVMNSPADENESADKLEEYTQNRAITDTLEIRYNNIKKALERIADGTYGTCEVGGERIEEERLEANPSATTCKAHMNEAA
jgi:RNA polymerase-binding transcription factor DksA